MPWFGKLKILRFQIPFPQHAVRLPSNTFFPRATGRCSRPTTKSPATASFFVSLTGLLFWSVESNSGSSELAVGEYDLAQDSLVESVPRGTETSIINAPLGINFKYPRLSKGERTRILILEPGEFDNELKGQLKHVRSLRDHDYEALSYVWGDTSGNYVMCCSGMLIRITANLDAALRRLRHPDQPRLIWVDAICINQADIIEKSHQVQNMREIYANAKQVVVWLGKAEKKDSLAFNSLRRLHVRMGFIEDSWFLIRLGWYKDKSGNVFSGGAHRSMVTDIEYEHLINLLCRQWFRRTWVIQEVASAQSAIILYGEESMQWEAFADVYMRLGDQFLPVGQFAGQYAQHALESIAAIETARRSHSGPLAMTLFHILVATSFSKCKYQRDKIFAVLGLAKDWKEKKVLIPDYDTREEKALEVFKEFAVTDTNHNRDLRILSCASGPSALEDPPLPSWVPDWTKIENAHPFVLYSDRTKFAASGGMKAVAWHSDNQRILHVTGKHIDSVEKLGSEPKFTKAIAIFQINHNKIEKLQNSWKWLQECLNLASDENGNLSAKRNKEFWRTMMCGLTGEAFPAPDRYSIYFAKYMDFMATASQRFSNYLIESKSMDGEVRGLDEVIPHFGTHSIIEASLHKWSSRRRFCTTFKGRLACIPKGSREGDFICILFGGEVPYVLRPMNNGYYCVIGECYVDDIMHGESLSDDTTTQVFQLR
jgi:hypothetical protein